MRTIKFRAWSKVDKRFLDWEEETRFFPMFWFAKQEVKHCEFLFQQFTGLLDKNGKEIYEGDILMLHGSDPADTKYHPKRVMEWGYAGFDLKKMGVPEKNAIVKPKPALMKDFEVVGNIYQNPELLNN